MYRNIINKIAILIILLSATKVGISQDIHFSQYGETPVVINPALIATAYDTRAIINYRSQWGSVAKAYTTFGFTFEQAINHRKLRKNYFGLALSVYRDVAGDARLGSLMPNLGFNYLTKVSQFGKLSGGLQAGVIYRSIDVSKLQWDSQFDEYEYKADLPSGEATPRSGIVGFDMGGGVNFHYAKSERYISAQDGAKFDIGFSTFHYEIPPNSFWLSSEKLYTKTIAYFNGDFGIKSMGIVLIPSLIYMRQGPSTETTVGFLCKYIIEDQATYTSLKKGSSFTFGAYYRTNDALIPTILYQNGTYAIGVSYDLNLSDLTPASKTKGGLEISLRYNTSPGYGRSLGNTINKPTK
jgi:type IX secretion system PorP/SprF family membrane protein